jgi:hypothetical protein
MSKISKLGLGIIAFENFELLPSIIYEIKDKVDYITLCLQKESYHGQPIEDSDIKSAEQLKDYGYVDDIIWFDITNKHLDDQYDNGPRLIETDKRNFILDHLEKEIGCSHCMVIDSDEFYNGVDFERAKEIINNDDSIKVTYCQYVNYFRDYQHLLVWPFPSYVPFITESHYRFDFYKGMLNQPADPTRKYFIPEKDGKFTLFAWQAVKMHHLSWIRLKIEKKILNWSSRSKFNHADSLDKYTLDRYYNYKDGQNMILMFNTPENQVCVNKLPMQYIHPKFKITDKLIPYSDIK